MINFLTNPFSSVRLKFIWAVSILSFLILAYATYTFYQFNRLAMKSNQALDINASVNKCVQKALFETLSTEIIIRNHLLFTGEPAPKSSPRAKELLSVSHENFHLLIHALIWGTNSTAFRESNGGKDYQRWIEEGWDQKIEIPEVPDELRQLAGLADLYHAAHTKYAQRVIEKREKGKTHQEELRKVEHFAQMVNETLNTLSDTTDRIATQSILEIKNEQSQKKRQIALAGVILFILIISASWIYSSLLFVLPLEKSMREIQRISSGDLGARLSVNSKDEIGTLATKFNEMMDKLNESVVSRSYFDSIIQSLDEMLIVIKPNAAIRSTNKSALTQLKYDESEFIGKPADSLFDKELYTALSKSLNQQEAIHDTEGYLHAKDGGKIPVNASFSLLPGAQDTREGVVCIAQDISERKQAKAELQKKNLELLSKLEELEKFTSVAMGREIRIAQLKEEIRKLKTNPK